MFYKENQLETQKLNINTYKYFYYVTRMMWATLVLEMLGEFGT